MTAPRPRSIRTSLAALAEVAAAAGLLLWPALAAGRPLVFADDTGYWRVGRLLVVKGLGLDRAAPDPFDAITGAQVIGRQILPDPRLFSTLAAARSAAYGGFLFASQQGGSLWLVVFVQALIAAAVIRAVWRAAAPGAPPWSHPMAVAALATLTSLPFFASMAMPDVFAGLAVLIAVALALWWDRLSVWTRLGLGAVLAFALASHPSHLLVALAVLPAAGLTLWRRGLARPAILARLGALALAVGAAGAIDVAGTAAVSALEGQPARSPPFLTARLLADGPGRAHLRRACAHASPYLLCRFKNQPLDNSDAILWHGDDGVFMTSNYPDRLALEAEEPRFVRDVVLADPLGVSAAGARDIGVVLAGVYVDDALHNPCQARGFWFWNVSGLRALIPGADRCRPGAGLYLPPLAVLAAHLIGLVLAASALWRLVRARPAADSDGGRVLAAAALALWAILANAVVCGLISGPFARYEARMIWLVPLLGLMAVQAMARRGLQQPLPGRRPP